VSYFIVEDAKSEALLNGFAYDSLRPDRINADTLPQILFTRLAAGDLAQRCRQVFPDRQPVVSLVDFVSRRGAEARQSLFEEGVNT